MNFHNRYGKNPKANKNIQNVINIWKGETNDKKVIRAQSRTTKINEKPSELNKKVNKYLSELNIKKLIKELY